MEEDREVIFRDGVVWVSPKLYLRQIKEAEELLIKDMAKISSLKNPKPKGWIKIRNIINRHLKLVRHKQLGLEDRASVLIQYSKLREHFKNILGGKKPNPISEDDFTD